MEALKYLYTDFLYRDVLSYMLPGAIALWAIGYAFGKPVSPNGAPKIVAFLALGYLLGLLLQSVGTLKASSDGWRLLRMYPTSGEMQAEDRKAFIAEDRAYNELTLKAVAPSDRAEYSMKRLERFSALKQIHGNTAMAGFVLAVCVLIERIRVWTNSPWRLFACMPQLIGACLLLLGSCVLLHEHTKLRFKEQVWRELISEEWKKAPSPTSDQSKEHSPKRQRTCQAPADADDADALH